MFDEYQLGLYEGKMSERERIIKILDEWVNDPYGDFDTAIELIKGEKDG